MEVVKNIEELQTDNKQLSSEEQRKNEHNEIIDQVIRRLQNKDFKIYFSLFFSTQYIKN